MATYINDIYLRKDYTEVITEQFAKRYDINLLKWIRPFGYYDQVNKSIISNNGIPDGTYIILGCITYPAYSGTCLYTIGQFNLAKSRGIDLTWATAFNNYPELPNNSEIKPLFPLFRVAKHTKYKEALSYFIEIQNKEWTVDELKNKILETDKTILENTMYRLRLAFQRNLIKEKH